jgi:hypothetical protein
VGNLKSMVISLSLPTTLAQLTWEGSKLYFNKGGWVGGWSSMIEHVLSMHKTSAPKW